MKTKLIPLLLIFALILSISFAGCGQQDQAINKADDSKAQTNQGDDKKIEDAKPVTIKMTVKGNDTDDKTYKERTAIAKEKYPNISVEQQILPSDRYDEKIMTMLATNEVPDILQVGEATNSYAAKGALLSLDEMVAKSGFDLTGNFGTASKMYTYKGKLYAIPDRGGAMILYYNRDMFDKAKVSYPTKDWTWNEFLDAAKKLTVVENGKTVQFGFAAGDWWPWWMTFFYQNGGRILDDNMEKVVINSKENIEALTFYVDLVQKYHAAPSPADYSAFGLKNGQPDALFAQGKCAMNITGFWNVDSLAKVEGLNWNMAPIWQNKERATCAFGTGLAVPSKSKNADSAFKIICEMVSEKGEMPIIANKQDAPANIMALKSDMFMNPDWAKDKKLSFNAFSDSADAIYSPPLHEKWNEMQRVFTDNISALLTNGGDAAAAIKKMEEQLKPLIEK